MWTSSPAIPLLCKDAIRIACCILLFWFTPVTGQEHSLNSPATEAVERDALKLLNDSDWAHTVKPSLQDTPCTYQNPAFPGLYPEDKAAGVDATAPTAPPDPVPAVAEFRILYSSRSPPAVYSPMSATVSGFSVNQMLFAESTVMPYGLLLVAGVDTSWNVCVTGSKDAILLT